MLLRVIILILKVYHVDYQLKYYTLLWPLCDLHSYGVCLLASWALVCREECDGGDNEEDSQSCNITFEITHLKFTAVHQWTVWCQKRKEYCRGGVCYIAYIDFGDFFVKSCFINHVHIV